MHLFALDFTFRMIALLLSFAVFIHFIVLKSLIILIIYNFYNVYRLVGRPGAYNEAFGGRQEEVKCLSDYIHIFLKHS